MSPEDHWALWRADPRATVFQSPAWIEAWWATMAGGAERRDVVVQGEGGRPVAALPSFVWQDGAARRLVPAGAGHSDYSDALLADPAALPRLWAALAEAAADCDEILLPDLRQGAPLLLGTPGGWSAEEEEEEHEVCPVRPLAGGDVLGQLKRSHRRKIVHDRNRADRLGEVTCGFADDGELDGALDALFALHAERWAREGQAGVLADPAVQAFHRHAAPALAAAGLLRFVLVRHRERIVAALLGLADRQRWMSYVIGVSDDPPGQSFGTLAFAFLIEQAAAAGATEFHFLRGEEGYKYTWEAERRVTMRRRLRRA